MYTESRTNKEGKKTHRYRFKYKGIAYVGQYLSSKTAAQRAGEKLREELRAGLIQARLQVADDNYEDMTLGNAAALYFRDKGQHFDSADRIEEKIDALMELIGADTKIRDIRTHTVNEAIQARRNQPVVNRAKLRGMANARKAMIVSKATQKRIDQRAHACRLLIEGKSAHAAHLESGYPWSTCKRFRAQLKQARANGSSDEAWFRDKTERTVAGKPLKTAEQRLARYRPDRLPSNATVNRDIVQQLSPIINYASELYEIAVPPIKWKLLKLEEPKEIVREYSEDEIIRWAYSLKLNVERAFLGMALCYGPRFGELFFPPDALHDPHGANPTLTIGRYIGRGGVVKLSRKADDLLQLPLLPEHATMLAPLAAQALSLGLPSIWVDEDDNGSYYAIPYYGMRRRLTWAAAKAGIKPGRIIHGMRHHAGTRILRETGNLELVRRTLGHSKVTTSQRYAHANVADMRRGIDAATRGNATRLLSTPLLIEAQAVQIEPEDAAPTEQERQAHPR